MPVLGPDGLPVPSRAAPADPNVIAQRPIDLVRPIDAEPLEAVSRMVETAMAQQMPLDTPFTVPLAFLATVVKAARIGIGLSSSSAPRQEAPAESAPAERGTEPSE